MGIRMWEGVNHKDTNKCSEFRKKIRMWERVNYKDTNKCSELRMKVRMCAGGEL